MAVDNDQLTSKLGADLFHAGALLDESPQLLSDDDFAVPISVALSSVNGAFTTAASDCGVSKDPADAWLARTEHLLLPRADSDFGAAADLAIRLAALGYILLGGSTFEGLDPDELLATAGASAETALLDDSTVPPLQ
jgi:hypothetical protein